MGQWNQITWSHSSHCWINGDSESYAGELTCKNRRSECPREYLGRHDWMGVRRNPTGQGSDGRQRNRNAVVRIASMTRAGEQRVERGRRVESGKESGMIVGAGRFHFRLRLATSGNLRQPQAIVVLPCLPLLLPSCSTLTSLVLPTILRVNCLAFIFSLFAYDGSRRHSAIRRSQGGYPVATLH